MELKRVAPQVVSEFRVLLLGPLEVYRDGVPANAERRQKAAGNLLKLLALAPGWRRSRDELIETLWPEATPAAGAANLRTTVYTLRQSLGGGDPSPILTERGWIALNPSHCWDIDAQCLEAAVGDTETDLNHLEDTLALYRGEPLIENRYDDWAAVPREHIQRLWRDGTMRLGRALLRRGEYRRAAHHAAQLIESDPLDEEATEILLRALTALGDKVGALKRYTEFERRLGDDLGVAPAPALQELARELHDHLHVSVDELEPVSRPDRLPADVTSFVGREQMTALVADLLRRNGVRLVTLVGPGGTGKTRLALHVARTVGADCPDGAFFVPLSGIHQSSDVLPTISQVLKVPAGARRPRLDVVEEWLQPRAVLLVLDTFEHVLQAGPEISRLLGSCPRLTVLATSREPLHLYGEHLVAVPPLEVPGAEHDSASGTLMDVESVSLFLDRARAARPDFHIDGSTAEVIAEICRKLEGLPLAIELAAARMASLSPSELLQSLEHSLAVLGGGPRDVPERLQSVRSAIAWSYRLLRDDERAVFARLGVFRGGCSAEAAEAIVPDRAGREVRAVLTSLAAKSLVRRVSTADGQSRYFMLDTVREFAEEVLQQKGELQEVRSRHFSYFAEESTRGEFHDNPQAWLKRWDPDVNNVRAALWWGVDHGDRETLLRFAYKIGSYFYARTSQREGIEWLERALHVSAGAPESLLLAARQLLGNLQFTGGDVVPACDTLEDVLARYRDLDDLQAAAECMCVLAAATLEKGDFARCEQVSVEQLQYARARTDAFLEGTALNRLGEVAMERGDFAGARELLYMSVDALHRQANTLELAHARSGIAKVHTALGEFDAAQEILDAVLDAVVRVGSQGHIGGTMINRAVLALYRGDLDASAALFEQALPVCVEIGMGPNLSRCLRGCGKVALERGRLDAASDFLHRVVRRDLELGMTPNLVYDLREVAALAAECGQPVRAAVLFGAVAAQHQALGMALWPVEKPLHRRHRDSARSVLERETWDQAGRRGGSMSLAEAATYALSADPLPAGSLG